MLETSEFGKNYEIVGEDDRYYHANGFDHLKFPTIMSQEPSMIQPAEWGLVPFKKMIPSKLKTTKSAHLMPLGKSYS